MELGVELGMAPDKQSSAAEITAFLTQLKNQAEVTDFMEKQKGIYC